MIKPRISIVTPTYNQGKYIEQTIRSVIEQNYQNYEYIIIDGGSTDNTVEVIMKYEMHLKYWVSEKDNGQANAINKGLQHCTGEIFNWLNSDDYLEAGALEAISQSFLEGPDLVAGKVRLFEDNGGQEKTIELVQHSNLSAKGLMYWLEGVQFVQPGVWLRRELLFKSDGIDEGFHYSFDWDLYIRYLSLFPKVNYTNRLLIHFRYHPASKTISMQEKFRQEEWLIVEKLSHQNYDKQLKKTAIVKWKGREWFPVLQSCINKKNKNKVIRIYNIMSKVNKSNIILWRSTAGAIKKILFD